MPVHRHEKTRCALRRGLHASIGLELLRGRQRLSPPWQPSGRRTELCHALVSGSHSLASVAASCWAKPNHGFFRCQHPSPSVASCTGAIVVASARRNDAPLRPGPCRDCGTITMHRRKTACFRHSSGNAPPRRGDRVDADSGGAGARAQAHRMCRRSACARTRAVPRAPVCAKVREAPDTVRTPRRRTPGLARRSWKRFRAVHGGGGRVRQSSPSMIAA
jgi:hypothetical protein